MIGESVTVIRGETDKRGNRSEGAPHAVKVVFAWGSGGRNGWAVKGESNRLSVDLFVQRGTNLRVKDRIRRANGESYVVVSPALWDQQHPFDGFGFDYVMFRAEAVSG